MKNMGVLVQKELREHNRNYKLYWIPIVFMIFGILEPVTNYYLPQIMESVGNLPAGSDFMWPQFQGADIFVSLMGQYQLIGILIIILAFMGAISSERKNGTATLLYVRPISFSSYFFSKWLVVNAIVLGSLWIGFLAAWYYIRILFGPVAIGDVLTFIGTYSVWIVFAVTVVLSLSAWLSTSAAAGLSILILLVIQILETVIGTYWMVSPWKLATYATYPLQGQVFESGYWMSLILTVFLIVVLFSLGAYMAKRNAAKTTV